MTRIITALILMLIVTHSAEAQEVKEEPAQVAAQDCKTNIFVRASNNSQLGFITWPCWKVFPTIAASYNPETEYYEFPLVGVGTDIATKSGMNGVSLYLTFARAEDANYLEWFAGPRLQSGNLSVVGFLVGYIPPTDAGIWQHGVDHLRVSYAVGPIAPGIVYTNFYVEDGVLEQRFGPAVAFTLPVIGTLQLDYPMNVANTDNEFRVGVGFQF